MIKRILPFVVTLLLGLVLGGFANSWFGAKDARNTNNAVFFDLPSGGGGGCRFSHMRDRYRNDRTPSFVLFKPLARYTDEARRHGASGVVRLRLKVNADGTVSDVMPLTTLPYGLTESAVDAAKRIEFSPATLYGQPISETRDDISFEFPLN